MVSTNDAPIEGPDEDELQRGELADELALDIRTIDARKGYVVGLLGPWGSGKTSLLNLIKTALGGEPALTVVDFNPWMFSGAEDLVDSFMRELAAQLRLKDEKRYEKVAAQIDKYSVVLSALTWVPGIGGTAARAKQLASVAKPFASSKEVSAEDQKKQLSKALGTLDRPIVVVVDDIDRLNQREVQDVFRLVRLTANFPNIIYVLAFDRRRVEAALEQEGMPGRNYLEKIVQTAWDIPAIPDQLLLRQMTRMLDGMLTDIGDVQLFDEARWPDTLMEIIRPLIGSMRDARRYVASARVTVRALREKIELGDLLALEAIRVLVPDVYDRLTRIPEALTTVSNVWGNDASDDMRKASIEEMVTASDGHETVVRSLIARLFPAAQRHLDNNHYGHDWLAIWLKDRRVAHVDTLRVVHGAGGD